MLIEAREVWLKDGEKLVLRSPTADDAENLLNHLSAAFKTNYRNMNQPADFWATFSVEKERELLTTFAESPFKFMLSAFDNENRIVGNLGCFGSEAGPFHRHSATIGMGMEDDYQGRGLGNQLLRTAIFEAKAKGLKRLDLNVRAFNKPAIALYEKVGFQKVGTLRQAAFIDGKYVDELVYDLLLT